MTVGAVCIIREAANGALFRPPLHYSRPTTPSFPPLTVIPAKAGITPHPFRNSGRPGFWIPACAGMTVGADRVDGFRRGGGNPPNPPFAKGGLFIVALGRYTIIPAPHRHSRESGNHTPAFPQSGLTGVLDSGLRRNDGGAAGLAVYGGVGGGGRFSLTQPSPAGRGLVPCGGGDCFISVPPPGYCRSRITRGMSRSVLAWYSS